MSKTISGTFEPEKPPKGWKKFYGDFVMESDGTIFASSAATIAPLLGLTGGCSW